MKHLYQVTLPYACFGIVIDNCGWYRICEAAPIGRWMVGKYLSEVKAWVQKKSGTMEFVAKI